MKTPDEIKKGARCCFGDEFERDCDACPYMHDQDCGSQVGADALAYINRLEAALPTWISVKEPPKEYIDEEGGFINYLVYIPEYGVDVGNYVKPANQWFCMGFPANVTHWMLLPKLPIRDLP